MAWYETPEFLIPVTIILSLFGMCILFAFFFTCGYCLYYFFFKKKQNPRRNPNEPETINDTTPLLQNRAKDDDIEENTEQILEAKNFLKLTPFTFVKSALSVGRFHKEYYILKKGSGWYVMSKCKVFKSKSAINSISKMGYSIHSQGEKNAVKYFLKKISSESDYVCTIYECEYNLLKKEMIVIRDYFEHGSLYDFVKSVKPLNSFKNKHERHGKAIIEKYVRRFGRCILEGLVYLRSFGFCFPVLSPANVMVEKNEDEFMCKLCDIENAFMNVPNHDKKLLNFQVITGEGKIDLEMMCFGKILFFLATGEENVKKAVKNKFRSIESDQLKMILKLLMVEKSIKNPKELLDDPYFSSLEGISNSIPSKKVVFSKNYRKDVKSIIKKVKNQYETYTQ